MINIWPHVKFFSISPAVLGWLRPWSCDQKVNLLVPENKITLKENICFSQKF